MVQSIKGKTSHTVQRSQPKTATATKKRSLTGGKGAKSASRAKSSKASSTTSKSLKRLATTGAKKSVASFTKEAGNFVRKHNLEEGIKGALIEFIKNFKF